LNSAKYAIYVVIKASSELKGKDLMKPADISDIATYLRLCSRPHNRRYSSSVAIAIGLTPNASRPTAFAAPVYGGGFGFGRSWGWRISSTLPQFGVLPKPLNGTGMDLAHAALVDAEMPADLPHGPPVEVVQPDHVAVARR
jgi:hypothetical protein